MIACWAEKGAALVKVQGRILRAMLRAPQHGVISASDYVPEKQPNLCPPENMRFQSTIDAGPPTVQASIRGRTSSGTLVVFMLDVSESFSRERVRLDTHGDA